MSNIKETIINQKKFYLTDRTKDISYRLRHLKALYNSIEKHENEIAEALNKDLNKSHFEAYETEIGIVLSEIRHTIKNLPIWSQPKRVTPSFLHFPSTGYIYHEPYGSVLIMSPWNYPFQLTMVPLVGTIATGNCAIVKPSEYSYYTAEIMEKIIGEVFDSDYVSVVRGGRDANKELLDEKFDYIFFTGSPNVGRVVMQSASKYLTPVTLELGGKSPCIVDDTAKIPLAAKRIVWGKLLNAGQTCIAPDYLYIQKNIKDELISEIKKNIEEFYGAKPETNSDYPKIISDKHYNRLCSLMDKGTILCGGRVNEATRQIAPTLIDDVSWDDPIMREEIFGPLLPIMTFDTFDEIIPIINNRPKPLTMYLFTTNKDHENKFINRLSFGGGCINDTIIHIANTNMSFGGVGESGMGQYHGKTSYETLTHEKTIIKKSNLIDIALRYPPFNNKLNILKKLMK